MSDLKSYDEMDASHRLAYKMGLESALADPMDELYWCKAHSKPIDQFIGLLAVSCYRIGRPGPCEPVAALIVKKNE